MKRFLISLGKVFGIPVTIHWSFWILIVWIVFSGMMNGDSVLELIWYTSFIMSVFFCVGLHELGHALAAKRYGIKTHSITFYPIGGVARLSKIPENPKQELIISLAGPLVNLVIASLLALLIFLTGNMAYNLAQLELIESIGGSNFIFMLIASNIVLFLFNMIPAFPMDGGRILRSLLAMKYTRANATKYAVYVGRVFAILFVIIGLFANPFLVIIAIFVYLTANAELNRVAFEDSIEYFKASDVMLQKYSIFSEQQKLSDAVAEILNGQDTIFLVKDDSGILGYFNKNDVIRGLSEIGSNGLLKYIYKTNYEWIAKDRDAKEISKLMIDNKMPVILVGTPQNLLGVIEMDNVREFVALTKANASYTKRVEQEFSRNWALEI